MDADQEVRQKEKQRLLARLAELQIEEMVEEGVFLGTPHYSIIELRAQTLGRELSRQAQERGAREVAANGKAQAAGPSGWPDVPIVVSGRDKKAARHQH